MFQIGVTNMSPMLSCISVSRIVSPMVYFTQVSQSVSPSFTLHRYHEVSLTHCILHVGFIKFLPLLLIINFKQASQSVSYPLYTLYRYHEVSPAHSILHIDFTVSHICRVLHVDMMNCLLPIVYLMARSESVLHPQYTLYQYHKVFLTHSMLHRHLSVTYPSFTSYTCLEVSPICPVLVMYSSYTSYRYHSVSPTHVYILHVGIMEWSLFILYFVEV